MCIRDSTAADVNASTVDFTFTVTSADFGGNVINTIVIAEGPNPEDALSRSVRDPGLGIGVQTANDTYTISVRQSNSDQTP